MPGLPLAQALAGLQSSAAELDGIVPTWRKLDEVEEAAYAERMSAQQDRKAQRGSKGGGKGGGKGGKGCRGRGGGRHGRH